MPVAERNKQRKTETCTEEQMLGREKNRVRVRKAVHTGKAPHSDI